MRMWSRHVSSPLMITQGKETNQSSQGKSVHNEEEQNKYLREENKGKEKENYGSEPVKTSPSGSKQKIDQNNNKGQDRDGAETTSEKKPRTFRRQLRQGAKPHDTKNIHEADMRKRNAELMETDSDLGDIKRARMEIDEEVEKETKSTNEIEIAGLQRRPGGTK